MTDFLDIGSLIEQTVQEVLGGDERAPVAVAAPQGQAETSVDGRQVFRIGQTQGSLALQKNEQRDLGLVHDNVSSDYIPEASDEPEHARPVQRGSFAANLWSGPSFFAAQILKKKF